jgi:hypothetical protein
MQLIIGQNKGKRAENSQGDLMMDASLISLPFEPNYQAVKIPWTTVSSVEHEWSFAISWPRFTYCTTDDRFVGFEE